MPNSLLTCPWSALAPGTLNFCEAGQCDWIVQPANAWSNLAYIGVGIAILTRGSEAKETSVRMIGWMAIAVGISSFAYHASFSFIGETLDLGSMYLFSNIILVLNLRRLGWLNGKNWLPAYLALNAFSLGLFVSFPMAGFILFGMQVAAGIGLELLLSRRELIAPSRTTYFSALGVFLLSYLFWNLDFHRIVCDPNNHVLQGHAAWHILNSSVFLLLFRYYNQFDFQAERSSLETSLSSRDIA